MRIIAVVAAVIVVFVPARAGLADDGPDGAAEPVGAESEPTSPTAAAAQSGGDAVETDTAAAAPDLGPATDDAGLGGADATAATESEPGDEVQAELSDEQGVVEPAAPELAAASNLSVTDPADNAAIPNTLRWAFEQANADATPPVIDIVAGLLIQLTCGGGGVLAYDNPADLALTINGNGATVEQTCAANAVIQTANEDLVVNDLDVTGGSNGGIVVGGDVTANRSNISGNTGGAGIEAFTGDATVHDSTLSNNAGGIGGGVAAINVDVDGSTISGNTATNGAGVWADQRARIVNSTITGNTATGSGGGVLTTNNDLTLVYATIVENAAPQGANVTLLGADVLTSFASVIALAQGGGQDCDVAGATSVSQGYNFTGDASCGLDSGPGDQAGAGDPLLGPLQDNGGPTLTRMPAPGSPLIDAVACDAAPIPVDVDQRGVPRPQGGSCDIGAVEVAADEVAADGGGAATSQGVSGSRSGARGESLPFTGSRVMAVLAVAAIALLGFGFVFRRIGVGSAERR